MTGAGGRGACAGGMGEILPDVLAPGLEVIFCGSAVGRRSAQAAAYYAGPGNRFWTVLRDIGLTPRLFLPSEYRQVLACGIGLTDLAKGHSGADSEIADAAYDPPRLRQVAAQCGPRALAFNGKRAGRLFCGGSVEYGLQQEECGGAVVFVLPSTSGAARRYWDEGPWRGLAEWLQDTG